MTHIFKRLILAALVAAIAATAAQVVTADSPKNPWGIRVVRFKSGTTAAEMRTAVAEAGASVITDLSAVGALAVLPGTADFSRQIKQHPRVIATWEEEVSVRIPRPDVLPEDASVTGKNQPPLGNPGATTPPDPYHDAASFLGETNPEGILQWDDNRMNVPTAWSTTTGDRTVRVAVLDTGVQGFA